MVYKKVAEKISVMPDGKIKMSLILEPEIYGMIVKYKSRKGTSEISVNDSVNGILNDFLIERLSKPSNFKSLKPLDAFDLEPGK